MGNLAINSNFTKAIEGFQISFLSLAKETTNLPVHPYDAFVTV